MSKEFEPDDNFNLGIRSIINAYEQKSESLISIIDKLNEEIQNLNYKVKDLEEVNESLSNKNKKLNDQFLHINRENRELLDTIEELTEENKELKQFKLSILSSIEQNEFKKESTHKRSNFEYSKTTRAICPTKSIDLIQDSRENTINDNAYSNKEGNKNIDTLIKSLNESINKKLYKDDPERENVDVLNKSFRTNKSQQSNNSQKNIKHISSQVLSSSQFFKNCRIHLRPEEYLKLLEIIKMYNSDQIKEKETLDLFGELLKNNPDLLKDFKSIFATNIK